MVEPMGVQNRTPGGAPQAQAEKREQYLAFVLGGEALAMPIRSVKEVIQHGSLTRVPLMPAFIRGVLNLRGAVVPVIDLSVRFGKGPTQVGRRTCIVILEVEHGENPVTLGVTVDTVSEVLEIGASEIEPAPAFGSALRTDFMAGVAKVGGRFVLILEVDQVLSIEEMAELASAREGRQP